MPPSIALGKFTCCFHRPNCLAGPRERSHCSCRVLKVFVVDVDVLSGPVSVARRREPFFFRQEDGQLKRIRVFSLSLVAPLDRCLRIGFVMIRLISSLLSSKRHLVERQVRNMRRQAQTRHSDRSRHTRMHAQKKQKQNKTVALPKESLGEDWRGEHRRLHG